MTLQSRMADATHSNSLGLDIGGANIKLFHSSGITEAIPFAMWLHPQQLHSTLTERLGQLSPCDAWGVTMTGELADAFSGRAEGVRTIVEQTMLAAKTCRVAEVGFYATPGRLVSAPLAAADYRAVASANWHALAHWLASWIDRPSLLIDIGSTTADLIPVRPGRVDTESRTDFDRLIRGELVYLGTGRTPICSLVDSLPYEDRFVPVMREVFANTDDCALVLGVVDEAPDDCDTCDRRPRTRLASSARLARMIGLDGDDIELRDAEEMAKHVFAVATNKLWSAIEKHPSHAKEQWIFSGHSHHLLRPCDDVLTIDLASHLDPGISRVGPAYAICQMMQRGILPRVYDE